MIDDSMTSRIANVVKAAFALVIGPHQWDEPLINITELHFDSLRVLELVTILEEKFHIEIDFAADDVQHNFATIARIAAFVDRKLKQRAAIDVIA
jgi:acyl carrier protein